MKNLLIVIVVMLLGRSVFASKKCEEIFGSLGKPTKLSALAKKALPPADQARLQNLIDGPRVYDLSRNEVKEISGILRAAYPRFAEDPKLLFSMIYNIPKNLPHSAWNKGVLYEPGYSFILDVVAERPIKIPPGTFSKTESQGFLKLLLKDLSNPQTGGYLNAPNNYFLPVHNGKVVYKEYVHALLDAHLPNLSVEERATWLKKLETVYETRSTTSGPTPGHETKFFFGALRDRYGIPSDPIMDLASVGIEQDIVFRSSVEFPGATKGIYGWGKSFHWTTFPALQKSPIEFETKSGDRLQKYRIRVERNDARVDWLNPKSETGPNYKIMATDGVQKGLVITDNGFPKADSAETLGEYIAFFKEKGFKFSDKPVENFSKYLEEEVSSGRMDYLIREGHNSMATFSLYNKGTLRIGRKPGNPAQEIVVFMPNNKASHLKNFSWPSMGEWLDKRGKGKPLYFVDTKCSSANSICNVLPQVKNANLQFIAPLNTATTFINHPTSPLRSLTEGLIERKPYAVMDSKITAAKKKSKIHAQKNGESYDFEEDNYIYPSSPDYKSDIQKLKEHAASGGTFIVEKKDENGVFQTLESEDFSSVFGQ